MNELALFAGAGGSILAGRLLGWRTVCAVEINPYCREILLRRQEEKILEPFPIWDDVRTFDGRPWRGKVDVVTCGDPCQEASALRQTKCNHGRRHTEDALRIIGEVLPWYVVRENPAHLRHDAEWPHWRVAAALRWMGYHARPIRINACCCGADHQRRRVWVLGGIPNACGKRLEGRIVVERNLQRVFAAARERGRWSATPRVCRKSDGVAYRVDRLRALGNGWVPAVARTAWKLLSAS
jgi:DNA (cytosine-5)-methyltransferase 1